MNSRFESPDDESTTGSSTSREPLTMASAGETQDTPNSAQFGSATAAADLEYLLVKLHELKGVSAAVAAISSRIDRLEHQSSTVAETFRQWQTDAVSGRDQRTPMRTDETEARQGEFLPVLKQQLTSGGETQKHRERESHPNVDQRIAEFEQDIRWLQSERKQESLRLQHLSRQVLAASQQQHALPVAVDSKLAARSEQLREYLQQELRSSLGEMTRTAERQREDLLRLLATLQRPAPHLGLRSLLAVFRRMGPREAWHTLRDYRLLSASALFDRDWYWKTHPDVREAGFDAVLHYLQFGAKERRSPGPFFDGELYLEANPDVRKAGVNPLAHYLRHGASEGRPLGLARPFTTRTATSKSPPRLWFFVGDSIQWLENHAHLTGVGKVSTELLLASLFESRLPAIPCSLGANPSEIVPVHNSSKFRELLAKIFPAISATQLPDRLALLPLAGRPAPGDHVLFTGLVWTPTFTQLFRELADEGIDFSVLVYDIIQIESPELCGQEAQQSFSEWLGITLATARLIYVSGDVVRDKILRWAMLSGIPVRAQIVKIPFGIRNIAEDVPSEELKRLREAVDLRNFVLSVGTIDTRKNQQLLCEIWNRLAETIDDEQLPQLVLAGRDDIRLHEVQEFTKLFTRGKLVVLAGLSDREIAALYRQCLFTAFPSKSEGYGLPVAESLYYGKLCLANDLPVVREHAGDFPWYFRADQVDEAVALFRRAITEDSSREAAEHRIHLEFSPPSWTEAYASVLSAVEPTAWSTGEVSHHRAPQNQYPGAALISVPDALVKSETWCRGEDPEVSIVIINWNAASLTLECIRQICAHTEGRTYEVVIADNGSAAEDVRRLRHLGTGIRVIELGCNRFFGEANNVAVEQARGRYVCFLNNDAFVQPGWLGNLLKPFAANPEVGATGPLFLFPDGTVQEAGAMIGADGIPNRLGRGESMPSAESLTSKPVDYISAAALVMPRDVFLACGGFDLTYEPAYYEDVDLCLKLTLLNRTVVYCPDARVIHIEGQAANGSGIAETRRRLLGDLNRAKFLARWGGYLQSRRPETLKPLISRYTLPPQPPAETREQSGAQAAVYTPFALTPGGGESYLLNCAAALAERYATCVVTPHPYSRLRLWSLGTELGIDTSQLQPATFLDSLPRAQPDLFVAMGNHVVPPVPGIGKTNIFVCQFPFPLDANAIQAGRGWLESYQIILVYSEYVRAHLYSALSAYHLPPMEIAVVPPPVEQIGGDAASKSRVILSVGRFFTGGHSKRHDRLIDAFKSMCSKLREPVELHLAGSSTPEPQHMDYLNRLMESAHGYPIRFHVNASPEILRNLYKTAAVYWHGTGIGTDLNQSPEKAEHFGITLVEAMSAQAVPLSLAAGGPREVITHGANGFLYDTTAELEALTIRLLAADGSEERKALARAAALTAERFSKHQFVDKFFSAVDTLAAPLFTGSTYARN